MSWDIIVMNLPPGLKSIKDLPNDFVPATCPQVTLNDQGMKHSLNDVFEKEYKTTATVHEFKLETIPFTLHGFRLTTPRVTKHKLIYAANRRGVVTENLDKFVPNLNRRLTDEAGTSFAKISRTLPVGVRFRPDVGNSAGIRDA